MTSDAPPVDWKRLNEELYSGDPAGYFRIRSNMLMLAAGARDEVQRLLEAGVRYDGLVTMDASSPSSRRRWRWSLGTPGLPPSRRRCRTFSSEAYPSRPTQRRTKPARRWLGCSVTLLLAC